MTVDSDSARFSRTLQRALLWPVATVLATALVLSLYIFELFQTVSWSEHSYALLAETHRAEDLLVSAQNDVRGFLLTGDQDFLKSYSDRWDHATETVSKIAQLVSDNPEQSIRAQNIIRSKDTWFEHSKISISHKLSNQSTSADDVHGGRIQMDNLRACFDEFIKAEIALRDNRLGKVRRMKTALAVCGGFLAIILSLTFVYVVRRQMQALATTHREALETIQLRHAELARSEQDLEAQKEWLRVTLTSIGDGVIVTDAEGRVMLMNHESERLTGWTQVEALHHPLIDIFRIVNEETRAVVPDPVAKVLKEKKVVGLANHTVLQSRAGMEWPIEDSAAPITGPKGAILGVVLVFHDATDMRLAQKNLKAYSVELEKKVADRTLALKQMVSELEVFSYTVSHDLRAPLRAMQGFSEAIIEDYADKLDDQGKNYLDRIKNAAARLDRLIQDLLSYTRISRQDAPLETLDLDKVVRDIIQHDANLNPPNANVTVEGTLPKVLGRESALNQVVTNLLGNAAKFVKPGTKPEIRVHGEDRGPLYRLWFEDKGIGIAPNDRERIFGMFVQANENSIYGGTGVGLAIVKKSMQIMHGAAGVESSEGEGSRFWVELNKA